ncbi:programmed cell death protein 2, c-terminal domain-containing protein [Besnoitia besnoiti]|uniref:Programmed cell death protein 2, c-terminal domain-containing protein n=1 Tax=Besnoitia besnoiti TaxID=94643 RepID=A0A2A9MAQ1_BESBE|nr:programmed cell death protein 2, c-terminal domain-containing protein [Besnoitia besnoiti]PFH32450.1 programmed cell death protein 2, c-terminal domain-containing protein [Besnoitia besnoiti]
MAPESEVRSLDLTHPEASKDLRSNVNGGNVGERRAPASADAPVTSSSEVVGGSPAARCTTFGDFSLSNDDWLDAALSETSNWASGCNTSPGGRCDGGESLGCCKVSESSKMEEQPTSKARRGSKSSTTTQVTAADGRGPQVSQLSLPTDTGKDLPLLPAFFIEVDEEPMEESTAQTRLDKRARELWTDYQSRDDNTLAQEDEADRAFLGGGAFQNEEYEAAEDKVLLAFQRRLSRSPQQIIRYSFGGKPLWIHRPANNTATGATEHPRCERCGAKRVFEMQLMPTLIHTVKQRCHKMDHTLLKNGVSPNWGTVAVFTCSEDCVRDRTYQQEFLVVQEGI